MVPVMALAWCMSATETPPMDGPELDSWVRGDYARVTPTLVWIAHCFLELPQGAERYVAVDGKPYVFVVERHYHPPGYDAGPTGWHKGVTVYDLR
jgi:hypothetical protein